MQITRTLPFAALAALALSATTLALATSADARHDTWGAGRAQDGAGAQDAERTDARAYDPLDATGGDALEPLDLEVVDAERERTLPIRIWMPPASEDGAIEPAPVVLFSHGLGGSCENNPYLGRHWAARGYAVVFVQHPGSDASVWEDVPMRERLRALEEAASGDQFLARVADVPAVLDALDAWNDDEAHVLHARFDLERVGMSGHSFGAVTTQSVSGQTGRGIGARFTDERIDAALAMSPSPPRRGDSSEAFGSVSIPWMLMTGTLDDSPIGDTTPEQRRDVFPHLPSTIDRFELVLDGAEHSAFGERESKRSLGSRDGRGNGIRGATSRNSNHHRAILALSTAFWDAYLMNDAGALEWLHGEGPRSVLEDADVWQAERAAR